MLAVKHVAVALFCRLCSLTLTRLVVLKPLESDLQSLIIAIKMQVIITNLRTSLVPLMMLKFTT